METVWGMWTLAYPEANRAYTSVTNCPTSSSSQHEAKPHQTDVGRVMAFAKPMASTPTVKKGHVEYEQWALMKSCFGSDIQLGCNASR